MKLRHSYVGILDGVKGVWCDKKPKGIQLEKMIDFYSADSGKVFVDKEGNMTASVVIKDGVDIKDYTEIVLPKKDEE